MKKDTHHKISLSDRARVLQKLPHIAKTRMGTAFTQERQGADICPDSFSLQAASAKKKQAEQKSLRPLINECSLFLTGTAFTTGRHGSDIDCLWMLGEHNTTTIFSWQGPLPHTKDKGPAKYIMMPPMDASSPELLSCRKDKVQKKHIAINLWQSLFS